MEYVNTGDFWKRIELEDAIEKILANKFANSFLSAVVMGYLWQKIVVPVCPSLKLDLYEIYKQGLNDVSS